MKNKLIEYKPDNNLSRYVDSFWFFRNNTEQTIRFPVVPDGCSDIIFYLKQSNVLDGVNETFVTGIMESSELVPVSRHMELFGIRFKPGILGYLLKTDMNSIKDNMVNLSQLNSQLSGLLRINSSASDDSIIADISRILEKVLLETYVDFVFVELVEKIVDEPEVSIQELAESYGCSIKSLQRIFCKRLGITPKKFARIMRFQKAHKLIGKEGIADLVMVALSSGYYDQAHFNRDYKKLTGFYPSSETMSILYNS